MKKVSVIVMCLALTCMSFIIDVQVSSREKPWITIQVYRDSVTYKIRDYQEETIKGSHNFMNNEYYIMIKKLPGNEKDTARIEPTAQ